MRFRLLLLSWTGGRGGRRLAPWGWRGAVGDATPDAHLRNELGLAEGAHVAGQHRRAAQQGPWSARVIGSNLWVDHLLDLREEEIACWVRKDQHICMCRYQTQRRGSTLSCGFPMGHPQVSVHSILTPAQLDAPLGGAILLIFTLDRESAPQPLLESSVQLWRDHFMILGFPSWNTVYLCTYSLCSVIAKCIDVGSQVHFESWFCCLYTGWLWPSYLTSLCLSFFIWKIWIMIKLTF